MQRQEPVQAVLDSYGMWMEERFRRAYTDEDFNKLAKGTLEAIMKSAEPTLPAKNRLSQTASSNDPGSRFHAGLVEGTGPGLETETRLLLKVRLRALTLVFLVIWLKKEPLLSHKIFFVEIW